MIDRQGGGQADGTYRPLRVARHEPKEDEAGMKRLITGMALLLLSALPLFSINKNDLLGLWAFDPYNEAGWYPGTYQFFDDDTFIYCSHYMDIYQHYYKGTYSIQGDSLELIVTKDLWNYDIERCYDKGDAPYTYNDPIHLPVKIIAYATEYSTPFPTRIMFGKREFMLLLKKSPPKLFTVINNEDVYRKEKEEQK